MLHYNVQRTEQINLERFFFKPVWLCRSVSVTQEAGTIPSVAVRQWPEILVLSSVVKILNIYMVYF